jgi:hypothetical protein
MLHIQQRCMSLFLRIFGHVSCINKNGSHRSYLKPDTTQVVPSIPGRRRKNAGKEQESTQKGRDRKRSKRTGRSENRSQNHAFLFDNFSSISRCCGSALRYGMAAWAPPCRGSEGEQTAMCVCRCTHISSP